MRERALGSPAGDGEWSRDLKAGSMTPQLAATGPSWDDCREEKVPGKKANNSAAPPLPTWKCAKVILDVSLGAGFQLAVQIAGTSISSQGLLSFPVDQRGWSSLVKQQDHPPVLRSCDQRFFMQQFTGVRGRRLPCSTITTIGLQTARCVPLL